MGQYLRGHNEMPSPHAKPCGRMEGTVSRETEPDRWVTDTRQLGP